MDNGTTAAHDVSAALVATGRSRPTESSSERHLANFDVAVITLLAKGVLGVVVVVESSYNDLSMSLLLLLSSPLRKKKSTTTTPMKRRTRTKKRHTASSTIFILLFLVVLGTTVAGEESSLGAPVPSDPDDGNNNKIPVVTAVPLKDYNAAYFCTSSFSCQVATFGQYMNDVPFVDVAPFQLPYDGQGRLRPLIKPLDQVVVNVEQTKTVQVGDSANFSLAQERLVGLWMNGHGLLSPIYTDRVFNRAERPYVQGVYFPANQTTELSFRFLDWYDRQYYLYAQLQCQGLVPSLYYTRLLLEQNKTLPRSNWTACQEGAHRVEQWSRNFYDRARPVTFDPRQQRIRAALLLFSGSVSVLASSFLVFAIVVRWRNNQRSTTRDRILLGMSLIDVNNSLALALGPILSPNQSIDVILSSGNQTLCSMQGFGIQLGFGVPIYNAMLCIFFLLVIAFQQDDSVIENRFEWIFHLGAAGFAVSSALAGIFLNLYNPNGTFCWIEPGPYNCKSVDHMDCIRADDAEKYQWAFGGYPVIASFAIVIVTMTWIYVLVWYRGFIMNRRYGTAHQGSAYLSRQTAVQASLFVAALTITYVWGFIISMFLVRGREHGFALHAANAFFLPLQGFWNFFIFIRLAFAKERKTHPEKSWLWVLRRAMQKESTMYVQSRGNGPRGRRNLGRVLGQSFDSNQIGTRRSIVHRVCSRISRSATLSGLGSSDESLGQMDSGAQTKGRLRDGHRDRKPEEALVLSVKPVEQDNSVGEKGKIRDSELGTTVMSGESPGLPSV